MPSTATIRAATPDDIPAMIQIETQSPGAAHWRADDYECVFSVATPPRLALVAEEGGRVMGFLVAQCLGPAWEIENLAVATAARRRGFARGLASELIGRARNAHAEGVFLEVRESNHAARALYEMLGFIQTGRRREYYRAPAEDALLYTFSFSSPGAEVRQEPGNAS